MAVRPDDIVKYPFQRPLINGGRIEASRLDFSQAGIGLLLPQKRGYLYEDGSGISDPKGNVQNLFRRKINLSYWEYGQIDCAFEGLPLRTIQRLDLLSETTLPDGKVLFWPSQSTALALGGNKYLINLKNWTHPDWKPKGLGDLEGIGRKFNILQEAFCRIYPISSASSVGHMLVLHHPEEFYWTEKFNEKGQRHILPEYHRAYKTQLEYKTMGRLDGVVNYDMPKAHLLALRDLPSMDRYNIIRVYEGLHRQPNAHPGSLVKIETTIPRELNFGPIPYKGKWPTGHIPLSDPFPIEYLDILEALGIPYQIKWSYQILLKDTNKRPWKDFADTIWMLEEKLAEEVYPLLTKIFHWTIAGHMLAAYCEYEKDDPSVVKLIRTSIDYNPPMALGIIGKIHKWNYLGGYEDAEALRVDEYSKRRGRTNSSKLHREKTAGDMIVVMENLRDLPGQDLIRETLEPFKDFRSFILKKTSYRSLRSGKYSRAPLGSPYEDQAVIRPGPYNRILEDALLLRVGDYLEGEIITLSPTIVEEGGLLNIYDMKIRSDWLADWRKQNG